MSGPPIRDGPSRRAGSPADVGDGAGDLGAIVIAVAENEVRVRWEEPYGGAVADVAAVEDQLDAA